MSIQFNYRSTEVECQIVVNNNVFAVVKTTDGFVYYRVNGSAISSSNSVCTKIAQMCRYAVRNGMNDDACYGVRNGKWEIIG